MVSVVKTALLVSSLMTFPLAAQEYRATISGRVTDTQDAVIPGVRIVAVETQRKLRAETISNQRGEFVLPFLEPGSYDIQAETQGFKRYSRPNFVVGTNQRIEADIRLEVGVVTDTITITEEAPLLTTSSASTGQVINAQQVESMPMNGRTPLVLAQLAFGVTPSSDPRFTRPFDNSGPSGFSMGGAPAQQNELLIDGTPDMTRNRRVAYNPPVDAVNEVKVETFQADAAYGNTGGGTVNVVMKGGGNDFHGTVYEFNQVSRYAATPFFTNRAGQRKSVTRFNQFGFTVGGPVLIPKLFNGRNKLFFFLTYEGIKQSSLEPQTSTVPTDEERRGDFSALLKAGANYQIYNPYTAVREGARIRRQPFENNVIPTALLNKIGVAALQYYPRPNQVGRIDGQDNYLAPSIRADDFYNWIGRADYNVNARNHFFVNARYNDRIEDRGNRFFNIATGGFLSRVNWGAQFDDVHTFSPTMVLNTRFGWTRFIEGNTRSSDGFDFTSLGFPASLRAASPKNLLPRFDLDNFTDIGDSGGGINPFDTYQLFSSVTKSLNRHTLKFGADIRRLNDSAIDFGNSSGNYVFRGNFMRGPLDSAADSPLGQDLATMLLGLPTSGNFDLNAFRTNQSWYTAFFVQDDWRVSPTLTLNLGLRYERETGTTERYNRQLNGFDSTSPNAITGRAKAAYALNPNALLPAGAFNPVGGVTFADSNNRSAYTTDSHLLSPRIGVAWNPAMFKNKTVFRGGFGIFYFTYGVVPSEQPGFSQSTPYVATLDAFLTPASTLSNPFANILPPVGNANGINTFFGQNVNFVNPRASQPYSVRWNFNIQHQISKNTVLEIGYVGNHAVHLSEIRLNNNNAERELNFIPRSFLSTSPVRDQANIDRIRAVVPNPFAGLLPGTSLNGSTVSLEQLLRQFPQFNGNAGVRILGQNNGSSYFHMLQVRLEKRFSNGFNLLANYGWQRLIERRSRLNWADPGLEKRISEDDRPHRFVTSSSYELPFGAGKTLFSSSPGWANKLIGGWVVNGIFIVQSNSPVVWDSNPLYLGGDLKWNAHNIDNAFDRTRFVTDSRQQLDLNLRTFPSRFKEYRSDLIKNFDASIIKNTLIKERFTVQLRLEAFNALNHPIFGTPERNPTNSNFGKITSQSNLPRAVQMAIRLKF